jgi:hypothetical protein
VQPGQSIDETDVSVELSNNVLTIDGEKKSEIEDQNRWFSERYYGHFERRILMRQAQCAVSISHLSPGRSTITDTEPSSFSAKSK